MNQDIGIQNLSLNKTHQQENEKCFFVSCTVSKARNLDKICPKINPFCVLSLNDHKRTTKFRYNTSNPVQNERLDIVCPPSSNSRVPKLATLSIYNYKSNRNGRRLDLTATGTGTSIETPIHKLHKDDLIGQCSINLENLIYDTPHFKQIDIIRSNESSILNEQATKVSGDFDYIGTPYKPENSQQTSSLLGDDLSENESLYQPLNGTNVGTKAGQVYCQVVVKPIDAVRRHHFSQTDLMQLSINRAEHLPMFLKSINSIQVTVSLDQQQFRTSSARRSFEPVFNELGFFFVDTRSMDGFRLKVSVWYRDGDGNANRIGTGFLNTSSIFANREYEGQIVLYDNPDKSNQQKQLRKQENFREIGMINLMARLIPRQKLERRFCQTILSEFDSDFDGRLSKQEAFEMFMTLQPDTLSFFEQYFKDLYSNSDSYIDNNDLINFLSSSSFNSNPFLNKIILATLTGRPMSSNLHLMRGCTYLPKASAPTLYVIDRRTGKQVEEKVPAYIEVGSRLLTSPNSINNQISSYVPHFLKQISERQGRKFDSQKSVSEIPHFILLHNIDCDEIKKPLRYFKTFNEFFSRELIPSARPVSNPYNPLICVCPSDCRLTVYQNIESAKKFWIKGRNFSLSNLLGSCSKDLSLKFNGGSMVICRMVPQDYHRWHFPVNGTHGRITDLDGDLNSTCPSVINRSDIDDVICNNKRCIVEIYSPEFGTILMIIIASVMVGSYEIFGHPLENWEKGRTHGRFKFGGSTILLVFRRDRIVFDPDLVKNSQLPMETLVRANERIGIACQPNTTDNNSNFSKKLN